MRVSWGHFLPIFVPSTQVNTLKKSITRMARCLHAYFPGISTIQIRIKIMSLDITHTSYFQPSYIQKVSSTPPAPTETLANTDKSEKGEKTSPPLSGFGALLSGQDIKMLHTRSVNGDEQAAYADILRAFHSDPANFDDPVGFLRNLSTEGQNLLLKAQSLPQDGSVNFEAMNQEEALNFILPHTQKVDLDNDGFVGTGNGGKTFQFPPPNAPQATKDAWNAATQGMSFLDKAMMEFRFMSLQTQANTSEGPNGEITFASPDDPNWNNIFADSSFSYRNAVEGFRKANQEQTQNRSQAEIDRIDGLLRHINDTFARFGIT